LPTERPMAERKRKREPRMGDSLTPEIETACRALGEHVSPGAVMAILRDRAGKPGSCILAVADDGIVWNKAGAKDPSGKLSMASLGKRLRRHLEAKDRSDS